MTLIKTRNHNLIPAFPRMDSFFDRFFDSSEGFNPVMNIASNEHNIHVEVELPGVKTEDVKIHVEKGVLTISGEKKSFSEEKKEKYHHIERRHGAFSRSIRLPEDADSEQISASFENGILKVRIKKSESLKPRSIPIESK